MIETLEETASRIARETTSPVIMHRLLRDVLRCHPADPALLRARELLDQSPWI